MTTYEFITTTPTKCEKHNCEKIIIRTEIFSGVEWIHPDNIENIVICPSCRPDIMKDVVDKHGREV